MIAGENTAKGTAERTSTGKDFRRGTHRVVPPVDTVDRVRRFLPVMGITRVANVTGLDTIGIPVVMVCRPNSRSLTVSQGKGLDLDSARASGLMESIELWHAEHILLPLKLGSVEELRFTHRLADVAGLARSKTSRFHSRLPLLWVEGHDLLGEHSTWVPYETVHANYTLPLPTGSGSFAMTSNGLASGNHILEAISHGICEVVERDATTLWHLMSPEHQQRRRVELGSVDDPLCQEALEKLERARVRVAVWDTTTDVGIASFVCIIDDADEEVMRPLYAAIGCGTHPSRAVALLRSLTEAAQSRATYISGARDDMWRESYARLSNPDTLRRNRDWLTRPVGDRPFQAAPTYESSDLSDDVAWELARLRSAGVREVVVVELTRPEFRIPVVRIVIPGLEGPMEKIPDYQHGARAREAVERQSA